MMLCPNCSEYIFRLHLSPLEKKKAKEMLKLMELEKDDKAIMLEYLDQDNVESDFTQDVLADPYAKICEAIMVDRKKKLLDAILAQRITEEQAKELEFNLMKDKTYIDIELDEIIDDYERYKSLVNKAKILDTLENSDKKQHKWDI